MAEITLKDFGIDTDVDTDVATATEMESQEHTAVETESQEPVGSAKAKASKPKQKRKAASQIHKKAPMKRQNSLPDLRAHASQLPMTFSDMILKSLEDQSFINVFAPMLVDIISPVIEGAIEKAADKAVEKMKSSVLDSIVQINKELQETVKDQSNMITSMKCTIGNQEKLINENSDEINDLKSVIRSTKAELDHLKSQTNDLEQYGRRNSIRLSNFSCPATATEDVNTDLVVRFVNNHLLTDDKKISKSDIERCHPVGRVNHNGKRQMIVKFKNYYTKQDVFGSKSKLKNNPGRVFMSEDLTKANHAIVQALIPLRKSGKIASFWTRNGNVFAKQRLEDSPVKLRSVMEVTDKFS